MTEFLEQIEWRINGQPPAGDEWICTDFSGRGDLRALDLEQFRLVLWEAEMTPALLEAIYCDAYAEIIIEEKEQEPYEWGVVIEYDQLRHAGYPQLTELLSDHPAVLRNLLLGDDTVVLGLIGPPEPSHYRNAYAVHSLNEVLVLEDRVILTGLAVEQREI